MQIEKLTKSFGAVVAVSNVSMALAPGEVRALYGGNGSGKSTLAKIVGGVFQPNTGSVLVDGTPLPLGYPREIRRAGIAITFQELSLLPKLSVADNLALMDIPRRFGLRREGRIMDEAVAVLERVGLAHLASLPVEALQVGEKYLVELAKALKARPRYLVLDEITSALHDNEVAIVRRIIGEHRVSGGSALFVSHRVGEILDLCDTITVMRNGVAVADQPIAGVDAGQLIAWAGGTAARSSGAKAANSLGDREIRLSVAGVNCGAEPVGFAAHRGEILGFGGLPDQGQDRLLAAVFGDGGPSHARIEIDGKPVVLKSPVAATSQGIAFVSGDRDEVGFRHLSIRENLEAASVNLRSKLQLNAGDMNDALVSMSTVHAGLDMPLNSLSGGNQQKVLLARCFVTKPRILVAFDPTKGIDVAARSDVHFALRSLAADLGTSILITSSDDAELASVCDRVLVMDAGKIKGELRRDDGSLTQDALISTYLHRGAAV